MLIVLTIELTNQVKTSFVTDMFELTTLYPTDGSIALMRCFINKCKMLFQLAALMWNTIIDQLIQLFNYQDTKIPISRSDYLLVNNNTELFENKERVKPNLRRSINTYKCVI